MRGDMYKSVHSGQAMSHDIINLDLIPRTISTNLRNLSFLMNESICNVCFAAKLVAGCIPIPRAAAPKEGRVKHSRENTHRLNLAEPAYLAPP